MYVQLTALRVLKIKVDKKALKRCWIIRKKRTEEGAKEYTETERKDG